MKILITKREKMLSSLRRSHAKGRSILTPLVLVGAVLLAYGSASVAKENQLLMPPFSISVTQADDLYGLPWHIGVEKGFFVKHHLEIKRILAGKGGSATLRQLDSGGLPFGEVSFGAVVEGFEAGIPLQVIGSGVQGIDDLTYVTNPGTPINSIQDMKGKRWGYTNPGSGTDVQAYLLPKLAGMDPNSFKHVATGGTGEGVALLQSHSVDMVYVPLNLYYQHPNDYKIVFDPTKYAPRFQVSVIVATPKVLSKYPGSGKALMEGYADSLKWLKAHPEETAKFWSTYNNMNPDIALKVVKRAIEHDHWSVGFDPKALSTAAEGISMIKGGPKAVPWCKLFTTKYLPKAQKGSFPDENTCN